MKNIFYFQSASTPKFVTSNLKKYNKSTIPRIVWATKDFLTYGSNNPNIYTSKSISFETGKDSKSLNYQKFDLENTIQDLRTYFTDSDEKSFILMTNGSTIVKAPIYNKNKFQKEDVKNDIIILSRFSC